MAERERFTWLKGVIETWECDGTHYAIAHRPGNKYEWCLFMEAQNGGAASPYETREALEADITRNHLRFTKQLTLDL